MFCGIEKFTAASLRYELLKPEYCQLSDDNLFAKDDEPEANYQLSIRSNFVLNFDLAQFLLKKAAWAGHPLAIIDCWNIHNLNKDLSMQVLKFLIKGNNSTAMLLMGRIYCVELDLVKIEKYCYKACMLGNPAALYVYPVTCQQLNIDYMKKIPNIIELQTHFAAKGMSFMCARLSRFYRESNPMVSEIYKQLGLAQELKRQPLLIDEKPIFTNVESSIKIILFDHLIWSDEEKRAAAELFMGKNPLGIEPLLKLRKGYNAACNAINAELPQPIAEEVLQYFVTLN